MLEAGYFDEDEGHLSPSDDDHLTEAAVNVRSRAF